MNISTFKMTDSPRVSPFPAAWQITTKQAFYCWYKSGSPPLRSSHIFTAYFSPARTGQPAWIALHGIVMIPHTKSHGL
jgi:hypothetical protein